MNEEEIAGEGDVADKGEIAGDGDLVDERKSGRGRCSG